MKALESLKLSGSYQGYGRKPYLQRFLERKKIPWQTILGKPMGNNQTSYFNTLQLIIVYC
ncbi:hypothetical protein DHC50_15885 [Arenibacter sp. A80]|nr:hypothetical protein [Arenibacter sp. A80]